ncbi:hypothetical protein ATK17_1699 [Branchiibius hedensis]|uniref:Uncharacterized protein n=1 Tax=Branchiibius hedensis TaxID=672460 RepID=A0A2Y9BTQ0_9MICO|nr:hypothetical protein [Branchiibius hedensis]PWJ25569.1 hypothetical protein ATK17_1699 [Branchiibius hedensis]SSA34382.1 hypothetical protein SAMN04489750_1699 [Branchiibius hedensis]
MASRIPTGSRAALIGAGAVAAVASAVAFSPGADAATLTLNHTGTITTHLASQNQDIVFQTTEKTKVDANTFAVTSTITPSDGSAWFKPVGLNLAKFWISIQPTGPATGGVTFNPDGTGNLTIDQPLNIQVKQVLPFGWNANLVGNNCKTATTTTLRLSGTVGLDDEGASDIFGPLTLTGTLDIPKFTNCNGFDGLVSSIASGPGNAVTVALGAAS